MIPKAAELSKLKQIYQSLYSQGSTKRIYGIAYNHGEVAEKDRKQIWFDKPMSSVIFNQEPLVLPSHFDKVFHEVELGLVVGKPGKDILP